MSEFKKTSQEILNKIKISKNILLSLHSGPDGDSVGSCLSMFFALKQLGKNATIISGDSELPQYLSSVPGFDTIIQKNIFQIDLTEYDLFIILDTPSLGQISRQGTVVFPESLTTITIDHHNTSDNISKLALIDPLQPATCQYLFEIYKEWGIDITPEIAACLFVGIFTDTGGFKNTNTNFKSLAVAAELAKTYPGFTKIIFNLENSDTPDRIKSLAVMLNSIETFFSGHVAVASLSYTALKKLKSSYKTTEGLNVANMLKGVIGWEIGISMVEYSPKNVKVSLRTRDASKYDLSLIAAATGTGGGHKAAAGASINKTLKASKALLLKTIQKLHPELGEI